MARSFTSCLLPLATCFVLASPAAAAPVELMAFTLNGTMILQQDRYGDGSLKGFIPVQIGFGCGLLPACDTVFINRDVVAADVGETFAADAATVAGIDVAVHNPYAGASFGYFSERRPVNFYNNPELWRNEWNPGYAEPRLEIQNNIPSFDNYRITGATTTIQEFTDAHYEYVSELFHLKYTFRLYGVSTVPEPATWLLLMVGACVFSIHRRQRPHRMAPELPGK